MESENTTPIDALRLKAKIMGIRADRAVTDAGVWYAMRRNSDLGTLKVGDTEEQVLTEAIKDYNEPGITYDQAIEKLGEAVQERALRNLTS